MQGALREIDRLINDGKYHFVVTPNVDHIVKMEKDEAMREAYRDADLILTDGKPLVWVSHLYKTPIKEKISGSDLFPQLCKLAAEKNYKMFFLGAAEGVAEEAARRLKKRFDGLQIVGTYSPPRGFENDETETEKIIRMIRDAAPHILIVALGAPKQEKFIFNYKDQLRVPVSLGLGASLDFEAGVVKRAPKWMRNHGFEWLYRLLQDPKRLFKRYIIEDSAFFPLILKYRNNGKESLETKGALQNGRYSDNAAHRMKTSIAVATNKAYPMPRAKVYLPMLVGAALLEKKDPLLSDQRFQRDDIGENISDRNRLYCELTGLYWMWKHCDADNIGLVHYRRYFGSPQKNSIPSRMSKHAAQRVISEKELMEYLQKHRIIVPQKRYYIIETLFSHYKHTHYETHLDKTRLVISRQCPEYLEVYDKVLRQKWGYMFNMSVMRRDLMDQYCSWLFPILFELETMVDTSNLSPYNARYVGRIGELIFNVWLRFQLDDGVIQKKDIKELPLLMIDKVNWLKKGIRFLKAKFLHIRYEA